MTLQDIQNILSCGEGNKFEFKRSVNSDLAKEMVAFANASGGTIVIGINDDNTINGTDTSNEAGPGYKQLPGIVIPPLTLHRK